MLMLAFWTISVISFVAITSYFTSSPTKSTLNESDLTTCDCIGYDGPLVNPMVFSNIQEPPSTYSPPWEDCINDMRTAGMLTPSEEDMKTGRFTLPPAIDPLVMVPFYVFPQALPAKSRVKPAPGKTNTAWSDCYLAIYEEQNLKEVKRNWGYPFAKNLENHPWRVYTPEEALIYVSPILEVDYIPDPMPEGCGALFEEDFTKYLKMEENYKWSSGMNTLAFVGGFFRHGAFLGHTKWWEDKAPNNATHTNAVHTPFARDIDRLLVKTNSHFQPVNTVEKDVHVLCRDTPGCDLTTFLEKEFGMSSADWLRERPIFFSFFGQFDHRMDKRNRRFIYSALRMIIEGEGHLNAEPFSDEILPFVYMAITKGKFTNKDLDHKSGAVCWPWDEYKTTYDGDGAFEDAISSGIQKILHAEGDDARPSVVGAVDKSQRDFVNTEEQMKLRQKSRITLSLRGDCPQSQRAYEGFVWGAPTFYADVPEEFYQFYHQLPRHLPWRLLGLWQHDHCVDILGNEIEFTDRLDIRYPNERNFGHWAEFWNAIGRDVPMSDQQAAEWAHKIKRCFDPVFHLMANPSDYTPAEDPSNSLNLFRSALYTFRKDLSVDLEGSRVAENLIFETARMMPFAREDIMKDHKERGLNTIESLGLDPKTFKPQYPSSCALSGGPDLYEKLWGMPSQEALLEFEPFVNVLNNDYLYTTCKKNSLERKADCAWRSGYEFFGQKEGPEEIFELAKMFVEYKLFGKHGPQQVFP